MTQICRIYDSKNNPSNIYHNKAETIDAEYRSDLTDINVVKDFQLIDRKLAEMDANNPEPLLLHIGVKLNSYSPRLTYTWLQLQNTYNKLLRILVNLHNPQCSKPTVLSLDERQSVGTLSTIDVQRYNDRCYKFTERSFTKISCPEGHKCWQHSAVMADERPVYEFQLLVDKYPTTFNSSVNNFEIKLLSPKEVNGLKVVDSKTISVISDRLKLLLLRPEGRNITDFRILETYRLSFTNPFKNSTVSILNTRDLEQKTQTVIAQNEKLRQEKEQYNANKIKLLNLVEDNMLLKHKYEKLISIINGNNTSIGIESFNDTVKAIEVNNTGFNSTMTLDVYPRALNRTIRDAGHANLLINNSTITTDIQDLIGLGNSTVAELGNSTVEFITDMANAAVVVYEPLIIVVGCYIINWFITSGSFNLINNVNTFVVKPVKTLVSKPVKAIISIIKKILPI